MKTLSSAAAPAPSVVTSTMTLPAMKPAAFKKAAAPPATSAPSTVQPVKPVSPPAAPASATKPSPAALPQIHRTVPDIRTPSPRAPTPVKAKTTLNITMAKPSPAAQTPPANPHHPSYCPNLGPL